MLLDLAPLTITSKSRDRQVGQMSCSLKYRYIQVNLVLKCHYFKKKYILNGNGSSAKGPFL